MVDCAGVRSNDEVSIGVAINVGKGLDVTNSVQPVCCEPAGVGSLSVGEGAGSIGGHGESFWGKVVRVAGGVVVGHCSGAVEDWLRHEGFIWLRGTCWLWRG